MARLATFSDLPNELSVPIILSIAQRWVVDDKPSLSRLSRTSRAIHALVRSILFHTITSTPSLLQRATSRTYKSYHTHSIRRAISSLSRSLARRWTDIFSSCSRSFPGIEAFSSPMAALQTVVLHSNPRRIVATDSVRFDRIPDYNGLERFSHITHLHMTNQDSEPVRTGGSGGAWASLKITHILLDIEPEGRRSTKYTTLVTQLLSGTILPGLERLCVRFTQDRTARRFRDIIAMPTGIIGRDTRLSITVLSGERDQLSPLDDEYWIGGEQVGLDM